MDKLAVVAGLKKMSGPARSRRTYRDLRLSDDIASTMQLFLRRTWLDWFTVVAVGILTARLSTIHSTRAHYFPAIFTASGDIVDPTLAYPYVASRFSSLVAALLCTLLPMSVILFCQFNFCKKHFYGIHDYLHSFEDAPLAILGLAYSLVTGTFIQVVLQKSVGGYSPHFLSVCKPSFSELATLLEPAAFNLMYTSDVCTGDPNKILNAMESFPAGGAQIAFAGLLYLFIYLNARLRAFCTSADFLTRRRRYWKMLVVMAPVLLATCIALTLILEHSNHWYDVVSGGLIGSAMAVWGYKMVFVSLWDASNVSSYDMMVSKEDEEMDAEGEAYDKERAAREALSASVDEKTLQITEEIDDMV